MAKKDYNKHNTSPYDLIGVNKIRRKVKTYKTVNTETGEVSINQDVLEKEASLIDGLPYIKLYKYNVIEISKLDYPTLRLFLYICNKLKPSNDIVVIDYKDFLKEYEYKNKMSYYNALEKLLKGNYLVKKEGTDNEFYINLNYFFNGDRIKLKAK